VKRTTVRNIAYGVLLLAVIGGVSYRAKNWLGGQRSQVAPKLTFDQPKWAALPKGPSERYLILYHDHDDIHDVDLARQSVEVSLKYAKLPYDELTFDQWKKSKGTTDPYQQGAILVLGERQGDLTHVDKLQAYVQQQGGVLINGVRSSNSPLNALMGIQGNSDFIKDPVTGWHWREKLYPGLSDQDLSADWMNSSSLAVHLDAETHVLAESTTTPHVPYLWTLSRGRGHVVYWNTTTLQDKDMRGVFLQSMLLAQGTGAKFTVGAQVWYIDDFPSPAYDSVSKGNTTGLTDADFRLKQWDPDMQEIADKYNIRYSTGAIMIYNDKTQPPYDFSSEAFQKLYHLEVGLANQNGELGLHGYNHIPLRLHYTEAEKADYGYPPYASASAMHDALQTARGVWAEQMDRAMPTYYVPPSNLLSMEGERELVRVFPELRTISSVYTSTEERGAFQQEFLPDPNFPQIMGTPRVTSGYALDESNKFVFYDAIGTLGVITHFNHPDDVFDPVRSQGKSWDKLRGDFDRLVGAVNEQFPWLRKLTATELADELRHYYRSEARIDRSQSGRISVAVTPVEGPMMLEVRVEKPDSWVVKQGGEIVARNTEYGLLWVKVTEPNLVLEVAK
jgi:hypothetical protein